jgi:hypothetical protein
MLYVIKKIFVEDSPHRNRNPLCDLLKDKVHEVLLYLIGKACAYFHVPDTDRAGTPCFM